MYKNPPTQDQHQRGPICLWIADKVTESRQRADQMALFPLGPLLHIQAHNPLTWAAWPWQILKAQCPLTVTVRQRNMAQMKEQIKAPEMELSDEERANLSDAQFKTLVIRVLTEMVEYGCKIEEKVKAMKRK